LFIRGGTGVITDNVVDNITSTDYGNKPEVVLMVFNLQASVGPNPHWGYNIAGVQYPCPRQVGMGYVTGTGVDGEGRTNDSITYVGDSEPIYQWNNSGGAVFSSPDIPNYSTPTTGEDDVADYIQVGRDYINVVKPGYAKYTYPHPLRSAGFEITTTVPAILMIWRGIGQ
jgi:hypothetical protein